jgi:uncharacterized protein
LHINIRELISKGGQISRRQNLDIGHLLRQNADVLHIEPVCVDLEAKSVSGIVDVSGTVTVPAEFACSRCLCHFGQRLEIPFHERFMREQPEDSGAEDEDDDLNRVGDDIVDLRPYIEQTVHLGLPYIPLCQPECKGLNPETGADLNIHPSEQPEKPVDPRLAALQQWLEQHNDSNSQ